jgi:hypothetical protein
VVVHGVLGQQRDADILRQPVAPGLQFVALGFRHAAHFRVRRGIGEQGFRAGKLGLHAAIGLHGLDQRIEFGELAGDLHIAVRTDLAQQLVFERGMVGEQDVEFGFR